jgi:hypothetical protein
MLLTVTVHHTVQVRRVKTAEQEKDETGKAEIETGAGSSSLSPPPSSFRD